MLLVRHHARKLLLLFSNSLSQSPMFAHCSSNVFQLLEQKILDMNHHTFNFLMFLPIGITWESYHKLDRTNIESVRSAKI